MMEQTNDKYLLCERNGVFYTLMAISGFYGAFTYVLRGNVFCNAQTGNLVLMGLSLGMRKWHNVLYYVIPIFAYILGAFFSEILPNPVKHKLKIRWDTLLLGIEMCMVVFLGLLPESAPVQISQIAINFIASMQYNTFRQAQGTPMATTFATNHIRQIGVGLAREIRHINSADKSHRTRWRKHFLMLVFFIAGVVWGTMLCETFKGKAIFVVLIPLAYLFYNFIREDIGRGFEKLEEKPHGH